MTAWQDEFDRRCRRVVGVTDDTLAVTIDTDWGGDGCVTCGYGGEGSVEVYTRGGTRAFADVADLIRALDEVEP